MLQGKIGQMGILDHDTRAKCMDEIYGVNREEKWYFEDLPLSCIRSRSIDVVVETDWQKK